MNTEDVSKAIEQVRITLGEMQSAFSSLAQTLNSALVAIRDKDIECQQLHDQNNRLEEENKRLHDRLDQVTNELWQAQREAREGKNDADKAKLDYEAMRQEVIKLQDESMKLREIILNVASLADPVVNPKAPEVVKAPEAHTEDFRPAQGGPGSYDSRF